MTQESQEKLCTNCVHVSSWYHKATRTEPEDSGWECSINSADLDLYFEEYEEQHGELDENLAANCPHYELKLQDEYDEDMPDRLTSEQELELNEAVHQAEQERLIEMGHLDPNTLSPTDSFFRMAQADYERWVKK